MAKNEYLLCYECNHPIEPTGGSMNFISIELCVIVKRGNEKTILQSIGSQGAADDLESIKGQFMAFHVKCFEKVAGTEYMLDDYAKYTLE